MNQKHVTSLEIAKQLAEAGIVIESEYQWEVGGKLSGKQNATLVLRNRPPSFVSADSAWSFYPAPIATELLERLPKYLTDEDDMNWHLNISYDDYNTPYLSYQLNEMEWFNAVTADIAPNALALLLIRLTKDGLI